MPAKGLKHAIASTKWFLYLIFGAGLIACLVWLIIAHYNSQVSLHKELVKEYEQEIEQRAISISQYFEERRGDLADLAESQPIISFFSNKALGMSMQYGLRASLVQIEQFFSKIIAAKTSSGKAVYQSIFLLDSSGDILASSPKSGDDKPAQLPEFKVLSANQGKSEVILSGRADKASVWVMAPVRFKDELSGYLVSRINYCFLFVERQPAVQRNSQNSLGLLAKTRNKLIPLCGISNSTIENYELSVHNLEDGSSQRYFKSANDDESILYIIPIENTHLFMVSFTHKSKVFGSLEVEYILYFTAALLGVLLLGLGFLVRSEIRSSKLQLELAENEKTKRIQLERLNTELDGQIKYRVQAEDETIRKNEMLSSLNRVLLLALQNSSLEEVAQSCLRAALKLTGSARGFIGSLDADGSFKLLAANRVNDSSNESVQDLTFSDDNLMVCQELLDLVSGAKEPLIIHDPCTSTVSIDMGIDNINQEPVLLVPLRKDERTIGVIALSNKKAGLDEIDAENVEELSASFIAALVQKQTDEALRLSEVRNRTLVESITEGLVMVDEKTRISFINDNMLSMLGVERSDAINQSVFRFMDENNKKIVLSNYQSRETSQVTPYELAWKTSKGVDLHTMVYPRLFSGNDGRLRGILALVTDLSERKSMEAQMLQAQKLEAIGQLAAGIAHEINTPTNYVANNALFIKESFTSLAEILLECSKLRASISEGESVDTLIDKITKASDGVNFEYILEEIPLALDETLDGLNHIARIVRSMKDFAHPGYDTKSMVDLNGCIRNTVAVSKNEWKYVADLEMELDPHLPLTLGVTSQINQVLLNLIVNAAQALSSKFENVPEKKGSIKITTNHLDDEIEIAVSDNGPGISVEMQKRVFEPFFTTKDPGKGTGQGLAIAHTIVVEKHDGSISLLSDGKNGSSFVIKLPVVSEEG